MAFHEIQFPSEISYGAQGGPAFNTTVVTLKSGRETANQNWSEARIKWDVSTAVKQRDELDQLLAFFRGRKGRLHAFRFKDWSDYIVENEVIAIGDGTETAFQLIKTYDDSLVETVRIISKPVPNTVRIFLDGNELGSGWTVDTTTGIVTFNTAPANGEEITATFEFDIPARFESDELKVSIDGFDVYFGQSVNIIEVRV